MGLLRCAFGRGRLGGGGVSRCCFLGVGCTDRGQARGFLIVHGANPSRQAPATGPRTQRRTARQWPWPLDRAGAHGSTGRTDEHCQRSQGRHDGYAPAPVNGRSNQPLSQARGQRTCSTTTCAPALRNVLNRQQVKLPALRQFDTALKITARAWLHSRDHSRLPTGLVVQQHVVGSKRMCLPSAKAGSFSHNPIQ